MSSTDRASAVFTPVCTRSIDCTASRNLTEPGACGTMLHRGGEERRGGAPRWERRQERTMKPRAPRPRAVSCAPCLGGRCAAPRLRARQSRNTRRAHAPVPQVGACEPVHHVDELAAVFARPLQRRHVLQHARVQPRQRVVQPLVPAGGKKARIPRQQSSHRDESTSAAHAKPRCHGSGRAHGRNARASARAARARPPASSPAVVDVERGVLAARRRAELLEHALLQAADAALEELHGSKALRGYPRRRPSIYICAKQKEIELRLRARQNCCRSLPQKRLGPRRRFKPASSISQAPPGGGRRRCRRPARSRA